MQLRLKLLSSTALAAAAIVMAVPTASAQDIGSLEKRVKALEKSGTQYVKRSKKTVSLVVNGHMYRGVTHRDNGTTTGFLSITPNTSQTRVRWIGTGKVNDDLTVQSYIELGNGSAAGSGNVLGATGSNPGFTERVVELRLKSKSLGTLYLGQGYSAQASQYGADLSGTGVVTLNGQGARLIVGAEPFQSGGAALATPRTVLSAFNVFDTARSDRIRYDTPKFQGFGIAVDYQNNTDHGYSANYGASIGGVKIKARIGRNESRNDVSKTNGSISVLLPMGLSLTGAAGALSSDNAPGTTADEATFKYAKVGYKFKGSELGQTRLFVEWHQMKDFGAIGEEATSWGVGVVQIVEPLGMELVLVYHNIDLDLAANAPSDDIDAVTAAVRLSF